MSEESSLSSNVITSEFVVSSGAVAADYTFTSGGSMVVSDGGIASGNTVGYAGYAYVNSGGQTENTLLVSKGYMAVYSDGIANGTVVGEKGLLSVSGTANDTIIRQNGSMVVASAGAAYNTVVSSGGKIIVRSSGSVNDTVVEDGGIMVLSSGSLANYTVVNYGGYLSADSGAKIQDLTLEAGASAYLESVTVSGTVSIAAGAVVNGGKYILDYSARTTKSTWVFEDISSVSYSNLTLNFSGDQESGRYRIADGAENFTGKITVRWANRTIGSLTVGTEPITKYGVTVQLVNEGDELYVEVFGLNNQVFSSGGNTIINTISNGKIVDSGSVSIVSGGAAYDTEITGSKATLFIRYESSYAENTEVNSGGRFHVYSGAVASNTVVSSGIMTLNYNGSAVDTELAGPRASMFIYQGYAENITVSSGAHLRLMDATLGGTLNIESGARIDNGGTFLFDLNGKDPRNSFFINNYTSSSFGATFKIKIADDQAAGRYFLADGTNTPYVYIDNGTSSGVSLKSNTTSMTTVGNYGYFLNQRGGVMTLNVFDLSKGSSTVDSNAVISGKMENVFFQSNVETGSRPVVSVVSGGEINHAANRLAAIYVSSGGVIRNLTNSTGTIYLSSGATAENTDLLAGMLLVYKGATADNTAVFSAGNINIKGGGTLNTVDVYNGGRITLNGGVVNDITLHNGGNLSAATSYAVINGFTAKAYANAYLGSATVTGNVSIDRDAYVDGGNYCFDFTAGTEYELSGLEYWQGVNITVKLPEYQSDAVYRLSETAGTFTGNVTIDGIASISNGNAYFYKGKVYRVAQDGEGLYVEVLSGYSSATVSGSSYNSDGYIYYNDVKVTDQNISSGALYISSGGIAQNNTISGKLNIYEGGTASNTVLASGSMMIEGGSAIDTTLSSGGTMSIISSGAVADGMTVLSGGSVIYSSGAISNAVFSSGAVMSAYINAYSNSIAGNFTNITLHSGAIVNNMTIERDSFTDSGIKISGATALSRTEITDGMEVTDLTVYGGASVYGGTVNNLIISGSGSTWVNGYSRLLGNGVTTYKTGVVNGAEVYGSDYRTLAVGRYGEVNDANIYSGATIHVGSQGVARRTVVYSGASIYISGKVYDTELRGGFASFGYYSGTAKNTKIYSGGAMLVSSGNTVNDTTVYDGGILYVDSRATVNDTVISSGGLMFLRVSAYADGVIISSGGAFGTTARGEAVNVTVHSGGNFLGFTLNEDRTFDHIFDSTMRDTISGATVGAAARFDSTTNPAISLPYKPIVTARVGDGGVITDTLVSGTSKGIANLYIAIDGYADSTTVVSRGKLTVSSGGSADNTIVHQYGSVSVFNGGVANNIIVNSGGYVYVSSGGSATIAYNPWGGSNYGKITNSGSITYLERDANIYYGGSNHEFTVWDSKGGYISKAAGVFISKFDSADGFRVERFNSAIVYSGGVLENVYVNYSGSLLVSSGGYAAVAYNPWGGTIKNFGGSVVKLARDANIYYGGKLTDGFIAKWENSTEGLEITSGNSALVYANGTLKDATVQSGGYLLVSAGATLTGTLNTTSGAYVYFNSGSVFDFNLTERAADTDEFIINNLSRLKGMPTYTITVAENQQGGLYKLADNADKFTGSITIGDGIVNYGSVTVNGTPFIYETNIYSLSLNNGELTLDILTGYNTKVYIYEGEHLVSGGINMANKTVTSGQIMTVSSGGTVKNTTLNGGNADILYGGIASATNVKAGTLSLTDGATASGVNISGSGSIVVDDESSATGVILNGGSGSIDGNAENVTVNNGAALNIGTTGYVNNITVNAGGSAYFAAGSVITGKISIAEGANITLADGSKIELDLDGRKTSDSFIITNLNAFSGTGEISANIDPDAKVGRYSIAQSADSFKGSFSFNNNNNTLGAVSLNSPVAEFGDSKYILVEEKGNLYLDITRSQSAGGSSNDDWNDLPGEGGNAFYGDTYALSAEGVEISNWVGFGDSIDFIKLDLESAAKLAFDVTSTDNIKFSIYTLGERNGVYSLNLVQNTTVSVKSGSSSASVTTNTLMLHSGIYYLGIESTNAAKGGDAEYKVTVNEDSIFFSDGNNSDDWSDFKENGVNSFTSTETISSPRNLVTGGWVGFGDSADYISITLNNAAKLSFSVDADDAAKFTIYSFDEEKNTRKALQTGTLKQKDGKYVIDTAGLLLNAGTYYVGIESTNAAKGASCRYNISVNEDSLFFNYEDSEKSKSDDLSNFNTDGDKVYLKESIQVSNYGELLSGGWVGYGDEIDYIKISLEDAAKLSLSIDASDAIKVNICEINESNRGGKTSWSFKNLQSNTLKLDENGRYVIDTKELLINGGKDYYLMVQSVNASKGGYAEYNIKVNDSSVFFNQDDDSNNWEDLKTNGASSPDIDTSIAPVSQAGEFTSGWVGFEDEVDYFLLDLENSAKLSFTVKATDAAKFVIYTLAEKRNSKGEITYSLKALQTSTLKLDKNAEGDYNYIIDTKSLLLNSEIDYYVGITSTNAKKGGNASYEIIVNDSSAIFDRGDNSDDTFDAPGVNTIEEKLTNKEDSSFSFDGWVGMGDESDFTKFSVEYNTKVNFTIESGDAVKVSIYTVDNNGKLKQILSANARANKTTVSRDIALEAGVTYYMSVVSTNAKKGGNASFSVIGKAAGKDIKVDGVSDSVFETLFANQKECGCDQENFSFEGHYANCITVPEAKTEFIYGTPGNDKLTFNANKSRFVNGIALGDGNDVMRLADSNTKASYDLYMINDGSEKARHIDFADGNDQLFVGKNNCIDAAELISFGNGDDKMEIADNAKVFTYTNSENTGLTFGNGNDTLIIARNGYLHGVPEFGDGNDTLKLEGALRLDSWALTTEDISLEKLTGRGCLLLSQDEEGNLSASADVIKLFEDANIRIVNTISDNVTSPEKELADNTAAKATLLTANSDGFNLWLCGEEMADSVSYGMADTADYIKLVKNAETSSIEFDINGGLDGIVIQRVNARGTDVLAEYDLAELGNVISLSDFANGTHYFKISVADDKLVYGNITLK